MNIYLYVNIIFCLDMYILIFFLILVKTIFKFVVYCFTNYYESLNMSHKSLSIFTVLLIACFAFTLDSCNSKDRIGETEYKKLLDSAKTMFVKSERMDIKDSSKKKELLQNSLNILERLTKSDGTNQEAFYYLGYTMDRLYNSFDPGNHIPYTTREATEKISAAFQKVISINPQYNGEKTILSPYSKLTSNWGSLALAYIYKNQKDSALWAFQEGKKVGAFNDVILEFARNLLNTLDQNAVLFVGGDNDTFPLLYLQFVEGLRKDVSVINAPLLNSKWFPNFAKSSNFTGKPIEFTMNDAEIKNVYSTDEIWKGNDSYSIKVSNSNLNDIIAKKDINLTMPGRQKKGSSIMLIASDIFLLDIIDKNMSSRPLYFSLTAGNTDVGVVGLNTHVQFEGLALKIVNKDLDTKNIIKGDKIYNLITNIYKFNTLKDKLITNDKDLIAFTDLYRFIYMQTALYYYQMQPDKDKVVKVMHNFDEYFNNGLILIPENEKAYVAELFRFAGMNDKAEKLISKK